MKFVSYIIGQTALAFDNKDFWKLRFLLNKTGKLAMILATCIMPCYMSHGKCFVLQQEIVSIFLLYSYDMQSQSSTVSSLLQNSVRYL